MAKFHGGPADGHMLLIRRAPRFLRVVIDPAGKIDALDQLDDTPAAKETIHVYRIDGEATSCHMNFGRGKGGWYQLADYRWVGADVPDHEIRTDAAWHAWTREADGIVKRYRNCPECGLQPVTRKGLTISTKDKWCAECANGFDCPLWPTTGCLYDSPADALEAWEDGKAFSDETPADQ